MLEPKDEKEAIRGQIRYEKSQQSHGTLLVKERGQRGQRPIGMLTPTPTLVPEEEPRVLFGTDPPDPLTVLPPLTTVWV